MKDSIHEGGVLAEKRVDKHVIHCGLRVTSWEDIIINTCGIKVSKAIKKERTGIQAHAEAAGNPGKGEMQQKNANKH